MPVSTDVALPKSHTPAFPPRCVACGLPDPAAVYQAVGYREAWWTHMLPLPGRRHTVDVPACGPCAQAMRSQRVMRTVLLWAAFGIGIVVGLALFIDAPIKRIWRKLATLGMALAFAAPLFAWYMFHPPAVRLEIDGDTVTFEFRDSEYAAEFAALNDGTVV